MNKLMILSPDSESYAVLLKQQELPKLKVISCDDYKQAKTFVNDCNIILGRPDWVAHILRYAKRLEWVQSTFAGVEALCSRDLPRDYILTGVKGVFGLLISEYVFAYILALERKVFETRENQQMKRWHEIHYRSLQGLTLGICGMGSIGRQIASTATQFKMRILAFKRTPESCPCVEKVYTAALLNEFLSELDYLVITLPYTAHTRCLVNYGALCCMKNSAVLINVGRGGVIVQEDLERVLREKRIRGAVLDVFEKEPLPKESSLWAMSNVYITPHNAAFSFPKDIVAIFADNYRRFIKKEKLWHIIDFMKGY